MLALLSSVELLSVYVILVLSIIAVIPNGNCSSFSGTADDSISQMRDIQQKIKEEILKRSSAICKPMMNAEDARKNCTVLAPTRNGIVRGFTQTSAASGSEVDVFLSIPFAKPPVGDLRFRKPVPIERWQNILDATRLPNSCYQEPYEVFPGFRGEQMWNPNTPLSEDCLYLNLWVPKKFRQVSFDGPKPVLNNATVMIWIYGGGYTSGTSSLDLYNGLTLAAVNDVIVVSLNYRVGAFGFLYLGTDEAPGNMGLYDQAMAMQWIKDNVHFFGGNPNSITVFGESAGAGSITAHLLSPLSKHLVKRAILQSGSVNAPWSHMSAEKSKALALTLALNVGCIEKGNSSVALENNLPYVMQCLRNQDVRNFSLAQNSLYSIVVRFPFVPTVDGVFLPSDPKDLLKRGAFDNSTEILLGNNLDEGTYFILYDFLDYFNKDKPSNISKETFFNLVNATFKDLPETKRQNITQMLTMWGQNYQNGFINQKWFADLIGDYLFFCPPNYFAQKFAEYGTSVYYYYFTQRSSINPWGDWMGVLHGDEIEYIFGYPLNNKALNYTESERQLSRNMMKYFTDFAKTGKPIIDGDISKWPKYSREKQNFLILNGDVAAGDGNKIATGLKQGICSFWNEVIGDSTR